MNRKRLMAENSRRISQVLFSEYFFSGFYFQIFLFRNIVKNQSFSLKIVPLFSPNLKHMKKKLLSLAAFTHWANSLIFGVLESESIQDEQLVFWASHIINAQIIWLDRIEGIPDRVSPGEIRPPQSLIPAFEACQERFETLVQNTPEEKFDLPIDYTNTKGIAFQNELSDIFFHLINHSTHHRSQMAARLRILGFSPPPTDYIFYRR